MADPTGAAPAAVGAGISALVVAMIGVEPQALVWGLVGAVFGVPFAPPSGRVRSVLVFVAVTAACALLGTWAAAHWHDGSRMARNGWAMGLGVVFHPLLAAVVQAVPTIVAALVRSRTPGGQ